MISFTQNQTLKVRFDDLFKNLCYQHDNVNNFIEGVARVKKENGNYAFMMESVPMEYVTNQECTLQQVGELLDSKGYGIALPISKNTLL